MWSTSYCACIPRKKCGIDVPDCFILDTGGVADENILFATARYDRPFIAESRMIDGLPRPQRLHQEDFAQALGIPAAEKYEPTDGMYLKNAFALLKHRSANPLEDQLKLWDLTVFNFLIGNTDNHLKNLSLLYDASLASVRLAPAYDVISTTVYSGSTRDLPCVSAMPLPLTMFPKAPSAWPPVKSALVKSWQ